MAIRTALPVPPMSPLTLEHQSQPQSRLADTAPTVPALDLQQISVSYNGHPALESVTVQIEVGERVALIGPNGAGKSTLFRSIVGLLRPDVGQVLINGSPEARARQQAAYVPQSEDVDWDFPVSVLDVTLMGLSRQIGWLRLANNEHRRIAREALARVGMADYSARQIGQLSGGQKRRVFIARALAQGAQILLLDEPFTGVDQVAQQTMFDILDELRADGVTVLLATHDLNLLSSHFDELLILNRRLIAYGTPAEVFKPTVLAQAFGGQIAVWQDDQHVVMLTDQHV